jgi:ABC-type branched-subunit amino acid transport system ATPase component/predicted MFS family arabinose efflux permease
VQQLIRRFFPFLSDQPMFPLAVLMVLNAVDEFDRIAFLLLGPEIRDAFGLSAAGFGVVAGLTTVVILLGGLPVGFAGDRFKRTNLVIFAAMLWSSMSILTGLASSLAVLVIARFGSGIGRVTNETVHTSLLTDYYPQHLQGRVFGIHRAGNPLGGILGPSLAGGAALLFGGWRWAFFLVVIPTVIAVIVALRLKEPSRGEAEDSALASEAAKEKPIPLARGWRWLFSVPSLKRLYVSAFFGGGTIFALQAFFPQFFDEVFGIEIGGRSLIGTGNGVSLLLGTILGAVLADRLRRFSLGKMAFLAATAVAALGAGVLLIGLAPVVWMAIGGSWLAFAAIGLWVAPNTSVLTVVLPARIRSLGIGVGVMFFGVGGFVFTITAGIIADTAGMRAAITTLAPILFLASGIYMAASRFVNADGQRALQALALEVELRYERLTAGSQALLVCRGLDVGYDGVQVLFGVDFQVSQGEIVALLGTNGAGKSTLLRAISGVRHPTAGAVFFEGENITYYEPHETAKTGIVQVPGGRGVFPSLTVRENLEIAAWLYRKNAAHVEHARNEALKVFPVLRDRADQKAADLSGGEQQMLTLAQAFIAQPKLLMIDELTLGLAPKLVEQLLQAVKEFNDRGTTIILVEQSVNYALTVAQRVYFMEKGEIRFSGPAEDLLDRDDLVRSVFLEGAARAVAEGTERPAAPVDGKAQRPRAEASRGGVILEAKELSKSYGGIRAVDDVSFQLRDGQILGIIGPNGAGKTTLFDLISGFLPADAGHIILAGEEITQLSPQQRALKGLGRSFQDARLFPSLTVAENIAIALDRHLEVKEPVAAALALPTVRSSERVVARRADELVDRMGLGAFRDKFVSELSTGSRRIVDIACALAHEPRVLILDEPSSGIAQAETDALGELLIQVRQDLGCSLLVIEHDIPLISGLASELIALDLGRVVASGRPADVVNHPAVVTAYLGTRKEVIARSGKMPGGDGSRLTKTSGKARGRPPKAGESSRPARAKPDGKDKNSG